MSPRPTQNLPPVTKQSSEFSLDVYASIPTGELVVFAAQVLQADGAPVPTEEIVSICFRFFPHSFALKNYFYWPDSALVTRRLQDAKEKGLLKGSPTDGFEVRVKGRQAAKQVARALGVSLPVPPRKEEAPAPVETKEEVKTSVKAEEKPETPVVQQKKAQVKPAKKPTAIKKAVKPVVKKTASAPKAKRKAKVQAVTPAPAKKKPAPRPKAQGKETSKPAAKVKKPVKPTAPRTRVQAVKKRIKPVKPKTQKPNLRKTQKPVVSPSKRVKPTHAAVKPAPPPAKKKVEAPKTKPKPREEPKPVKAQTAAPVSVSKEEKVKAAKAIKQLERSDAYRMYRRNGRRANIGEFDFRNMLFATMESSTETLKRNMELFKRYAGIHFRTDLIAFLEFCEENFSALLISKAKVKGKR